MKNVMLTHHQKRIIATEAKRRQIAHGQATGQQLSIWANERSGLPFPPNQTTVTRFLNQPPPPPFNMGKRKTDKTVRRRKGKSHNLKVSHSTSGRATCTIAELGFFTE